MVIASESRNQYHFESTTATMLFRFMPLDSCVRAAGRTLVFC